MKSRMSRRVRLLAAVLAVLITTGFGLFGMTRSNEGLGVSITSTNAILNQKQADKMHDALRGDVLFAMVTGPNGAQEDRASVNADLADHVASFEEPIARLQALPLAPDIRAAIEEQSAAIREIARSVEQAATGTREMSSSIQTVTDAASETGNAAGQMLGSSNALSAEASALCEEVEHFLANIRSL